MEMDDAAGHFYDSARSELIERIGHRDNALILYLGAAGAVFGVAYGSTPQPMIVLLLVPFLALGAAFIVSQHHVVIGAIGRYLGRELEAHFRQAGSPLPPQWDTSESLRDHSNMSMAHRLWSHLLLLFVPSLMSIGINWQLLYGPLKERAIWWFAAACTVLILWPIVASHRWRNKRRGEILWHSDMQRMEPPA